MNNAGAASRRLLPLLPTVLIAALITGCAGGTDAPETSAPKAETPAPAPETAAVPPPAPEPVPAPKPRIDVPDAAEIIGWDVATLSRTFGPASLVRRDLGAEIWQYRTEACVLFLFLYPAAGGPLKVDHLDVRGADTKTEPCLESVIRRHLAQRTG